MLEFMASPGTANNVWIIILLTGVVTYITRSSGHVVLARFKHIHPRVEAALEAVPGAVLVTIVVPPVFNNGPLEVIAMLAALIASFRMSAFSVLAIGMAIIIGGRALGL